MPLLVPSAGESAWTAHGGIKPRTDHPAQLCPDEPSPGKETAQVTHSGWCQFSPRVWAEVSRIATLRILPVTVIGNSSTTRT